MLSPIVGHVTLAVYAVLLAVGGVVGFVRARSRPSLIAGLVSAAAAAVALGLSVLGSRFGVPLGAALASVLLVLFGYRYARGRRFMPAGLLAVFSFLVLAVMIGMMVGSAEQTPTL